MSMLYPRKNAFMYMKTQKLGHRKRNPGREMPPENMETPLILGSRSRKGIFPRPPLAELGGGAASSFAGELRSAVWRSSDAVARPRGVGWRS